MESVCNTGGAEGADTEFCINATKVGHQVKHYSFENHKRGVFDKGGERIILSARELIVADPFLKEANKTLKRKFPSKFVDTNNLLRRNYYQVKDSSKLYAVTHFDDKELVAGGTAWAVYMFINIHSFSPNNCFVFDQNKDVWFTWDGDRFEPSKNIPSPCGAYAGIGSREINSNGVKAIENLYKNHI